MFILGAVALNCPFVWQARRCVIQRELPPIQKKFALPPCQEGRDCFKIICALVKGSPQMRK